MKYGFNIDIYTQEGIGGCVQKYNVIDNRINKFAGDKVYYDGNDYMVITDGFFLNKKELCRQYDEGDFTHVIIEMYERYGEGFVSNFRGSFSGVFYDKLKNVWIVFSDQIGSRFLYYYEDSKRFFCSGMMSEIYDYLKENNISYGLSIENAYLLLSYGFMIEDRTICDKIKKVRPGCYLTIKNGSINEVQYFLLDNTPNKQITEEEAIEEIDNLFRKAVREQFEKDNEYGYGHLVGLSAGLDSRMTSWVAHDLGYTDQLNYTFSQTEYYDEIIPQKIAGDLKHEWLFNSLDNGLWLYNIDDVIRVTGGNALYYGQSHSLSTYLKMNFQPYGMIHSGQLGDVVLGTWYEAPNASLQFKWGDGAESLRLLSRVKDIGYTQLANQELTKLYFRGFTGTNMGLMTTYLFTETYSPFLNLDFLCFALSLPVEMRFGHNIYKKWVVRKYPQAADYVWEKIGCKITRKFGLIPYKGKKLPIESIPYRVIRRIRSKNGIFDKNNMNPLGYYITTNKDLSDFLDTYYKTNIDAIADGKFREDIIELYNTKGPVEKLEVCSLLAANKIFFTL